MEPRTIETISASRIPAVLGLDRRKSPLTLFLELRGDLPERDLSHDEAVREGRHYERATAEIACEKYGMQIVAGFEQKSMRSGNLSGHPDFMVLDESGMVAPLEVKNPFWSYAGAGGDDDWGEPGTDQVPQAHYIQTLVYQELLREWDREHPGELPGPIAPHGYVVARLRGGVERFVVPYETDILERVRSEVDAMLGRVRRNVPPDPQDERDARLRWVVEEPERAVECGPDMLAVLRQLREVKQSAKELAEQESRLKAQILAYMQDAGTLYYVDPHQGVRVRVATAKPSRAFDAEACWRERRDELVAANLVTIDKARLRQLQRPVYESYMRVPHNPGQQSRVIRLNDKAIGSLMEAL